MYHTYGVKCFKVVKNGVAQVVHAHRWQKWREEKKDLMLHLTNNMRNNMARAAGNYFKTMFTLPVTSPLPD